MTLAATTGEEKRSRLKQWLESGEARLEPLTFPQRELWETTPIPPVAAANHICCLIYVKGRLSAEECLSTMRRVVERQEVLRLSILPTRSGAVQMIRRQAEPNLRYVELSPEENTEEAVEARVRRLFREPFDLLQGPLYRSEVLRRGPEELLFVFAIHHAIADGWSLGVLVQDLAGAYVQAKMGGAEEPLPAVPLSYTAWGAADRAFWQAEELEQRGRYWRKLLLGAPRLWEGTGASSRPLERWVTTVPGSAGDAARLAAKTLGATLFSTLLTAFRRAFDRWHGVADLVVGAPVANRSAPAGRETMGSFSGVVPLRARVEPGQPFAAAVRMVHQATTEAFSQAMPFAELVRAVGETALPGDHPVYSVRFALQNHPLPDINLSTLSARLRMRCTGTARFNLGCEITEEGKSLEIVWLYRADLFAPEAIAALSQLFESELTASASAPENASLPST